jgi:hypothetical protein
MRRWQFNLRGVLLVTAACVWLVAATVHGLVVEALVLTWAYLTIRQGRNRPLQILLAVVFVPVLFELTRQLTDWSVSRG